MSRTTLVIIGYGFAAAAANLLGGLLVSARKLGQTALRYLIALGAGFMLAAVFLKIVPETIEQWSGSALVPMIWLLVGYLLIQFNGVSVSLGKIETRLELVDERFDRVDKRFDTLAALMARFRLRQQGLFRE